MRVLWVSEYNVPTGFARVSKSLVKHLQKSLDITVLDYYEQQDSFASGVNVIGRKSVGDDFALARFIEEFGKYDAVFILNDVWNVAQYLTAIKQRRDSGMPNFKMPKIVTYTPVDAEFHDASWYKDFDIVTAPVTYTEFAKGVISEASSYIGDRMSVIPHGVDSDTFFKSQTNRSQIREHVYNTNAFNDSFIFMNANRNQPRKKLDITVRAFAEFLQVTKAKNAYLHLHCGLIDCGFNIPELINRFGVSNRIIVSGTSNQMQNVSSEFLNLYYNAADVGLNSSIGEGFGLTNTEHAVTGAPQIVPEHSACKELFKGLCQLAKAPTEVTLMETNTVGHIPDYKSMAKCMVRYYEDKFLLEKDGKKAMEYFSQDKFNWKIIADQFKKTF